MFLAGSGKVKFEVKDLFWRREQNFVNSAHLHRRLLRAFFVYPYNISINGSYGATGGYIKDKLLYCKLNVNTK